MDEASRASSRAPQPRDRRNSRQSPPRQEGPGSHRGAQPSPPRLPQPTRDTPGPRPAAEGRGGSSSALHFIQQSLMFCAYNFKRQLRYLRIFFHAQRRPVIALLTYDVPLHSDAGCWRGLPSLQAAAFHPDLSTQRKCKPLLR